MEPMTDRKTLVSNWLQQLQSNIIQALEAADGLGTFGTESWERSGGGGGITRLMVNGNVIEKGGVNYSAVFGETPAAIQKSFQTNADSFFASGVSIVIHPINPFVPIIHMNVRYFELADGQAWFGGGIDLTPAYVFEEDARLLHETLKGECDRFDPDFYTTYKENADHYFFIPHRNEMRGVGGIFYDRQKANTPEEFEKLWAFTQAIGNSFAPIYTEIMQRRKDLSWSEQHKLWQLHRRSRYVEFNLVYDSGTRFGLETNGRTESILMSMPPLARWESDYSPAAGTLEFESQAFFSKGFIWA